MNATVSGFDYQVAKVNLSLRVREVRIELYGEDGGPLVADVMSLPFQTWVNYEVGVAIPAVVILRFIELTGANPLWLLEGQGDKFIRQSAQSVALTGVIKCGCPECKAKVRGWTFSAELAK